VTFGNPHPISIRVFFVALILSYWPWLITAAAFTLHLLVSIHIVFNKRDSRAAIAWIAIVWISPFLGSFLYFLLGINRIERRARRLRHQGRTPIPLADAKGTLPVARIPALPPEAEHLMPFARLSETVTGQLLCEGNTIHPLWDGDVAYPAMLKAIEDAKQSVGLSMYIFSNDRAGNRFADALGRAVARGVEVRVLIDDLSGWYSYSWHTISGPLQRVGVRTAWFLPTFWPRSFRYANLRNHRKMLIVDGWLGFTGGMNISDDCWLSLEPNYPTHDVQFRIEGPIVARMQQVFVEDWTFTTGELLDGERWFPKLEGRGTILARGVSSGPGEDLEKLHLVLLGALSTARTRVVIVTPYFLPDAELISALNTTALRGVQVDILLPEENDLHLVRWAATAQFAHLLEYGCRIWITPGQFRHTKLMLVDGAWTMLGSANWDARSLRLNFEFNIECYDLALTASLESCLDKSFADAERMTLTKLNRRSFLAKLRDGVARLLMPYL
jgi:cardiolipin synthase A/B